MFNIFSDYFLLSFFAHLSFYLIYNQILLCTQNRVLLSHSCGYFIFSYSMVIQTIDLPTLVEASWEARIEFEAERKLILTHCEVIKVIKGMQREAVVIKFF